MTFIYSYTDKQEAWVEYPAAKKNNSPCFPVLRPPNKDALLGSELAGLSQRKAPGDFLYNWF